MHYRIGVVITCVMNKCYVLEEIRIKTLVSYFPSHFRFPGCGELDEKVSHTSY